LESTLLVILCTGAAVGFLGGYSGIGGAPILVAILVIFLGYDQLHAQGVVTAAMLGPVNLLGVLIMWDRVRLQWMNILISLLAYGVFSYYGAAYAYLVPKQLLAVSFGILLVLLGLNDMLGGYRLGKSAPKAPLNPDGATLGTSALIPLHPLSVFVVGIVVGFFGGFFGIGAGVLMVPIYTSLMGMHKDDARALSLAVLLPPVAAGAAWKYHQEGAIDWSLAAVIFIAYFSTNYFGAKMGRRHSTRQFKIYFGFVMLLMGLAYFSKLIF
jgi:uncharacterized protein